MNRKIVAKELASISKLLLAAESLWPEEVIAGSANTMVVGTDQPFLFKIIDLGNNTVSLKFIHQSGIWTCNLNVSELADLGKYLADIYSPDQTMPGDPIPFFKDLGASSISKIELAVMAVENAFRFEFTTAANKSLTLWKTPTLAPAFVLECIAAIGKTIANGLLPYDMKVAKEIDPKYQNKDDSFKDMAPVDDSSGAKNGFNGCVKYMMDKKHKGLPQENAEKLCGWIKQHKG